MSDIIITDKLLSASAYTAIINAPIEKVDIADWLFNLPEAEYQAAARPTISPLARPAPTMARACPSMSR